MSQDLKEVIWEWLPGVVAGLIPLVVFLLVANQVPPPHGDPAAAAQHYREGMVGHLLVFGIVTSSVSTFTAFPRLFSYRSDGEPMGQQSLGLVMMITLILVFSVALYVLQEARVTNGQTVFAGLVIVGSAILTSLYIEFSIANLRLARRVRRAPAN
jgi:FtsH-binding integral membrane protein